MPRINLSSLLLSLVLACAAAPAQAAHWTPLSSGTTQDLLGIEDDNWGPGVGPWIVGAGGYAASPNAARTVWTPLALGTSANLRCVLQPGVGEIWVGGDNGTVRFDYVNNLYTRNVPTTESVSLVTPGTTSPVAVGSAGRVYDGTADGGIHWPLVHDAGIPLHAALGATAGVFMVGDHGTILFTNWTWSSWTTQPTGTTDDLYAIFGYANGTLVAVGSGGTILRSVNGGSTWSPRASLSTATLRAGSVSKVNASVMVVTGDGGTVLKSTDGGLTWCHLDAGTSVDLLGVTALDDDRYIVAGRGGLLLSTADGGGPCVTQTGADSAPAALVSLRGPFPNPVASEGALQYTLPARDPVELAIFDAAGRRLRVLASGVQDAGTHSAAWDGRDAAGRRVPAGLYFARLQAGPVSRIRRLVVVR
jgi:photosystem II stability/assembly factor-like uncharacterized protein